MTTRQVTVTIHDDGTINAQTSTDGAPDTDSEQLWHGLSFPLSVSKLVGSYVEREVHLALRALALRESD
jgi:hypothetical protein